MNICYVGANYKQKSRRNVLIAGGGRCTLLLTEYLNNLIITSMAKGSKLAKGRHSQGKQF